MGFATVNRPTDGTSTPPLRVLVVYGDLGVRRVLGWLLRHDDRFCLAGEVDCVEQALNFSVEFDVALVDLTVSGLGTSHSIIGLSQRAPVPVVVVLAPAAYAPGYLRSAAVAEGAAGFLLIPDDVPDLMNRLAALVQRPAGPLGGASWLYARDARAHIPARRP